MRHAFRAVISSVLCLLAVPAFCLRGYTEDKGMGGGASEPYTKRGSETAGNTPLPRTAPPYSLLQLSRQSGIRRANSVSLTHGWVKVESGSRQAYVGIHGGTAPLSLMHSADGMLIAFTGQTGNDFMQVLKGGNASRAVTDHTDHDAADNTSPLSRASEKSEQTPARTASLAVQRPTLSAAVSQGSENNGVTPAFPVRAEQHPATVKSTVSPMLAGIDGADRVDGKTSDNLALQAFPADRPATGAATANTPGAAIPSAGKGPKSPDARVFSAASPVDEKSSPAGGTVLIFASSEQTSSMKGGSSEGYLPFGLTPSANVFPKNSPSTTSFSPQGKPLKLGSYQRLLAYSGKM